MKQNLTPEQAAATVLARLLIDHPELCSVVWSVGEKPGVLTGHQMSDSGQGEIIDACAAAMGGTVARSTHRRNGDGHGLAQLAAIVDGVPVHVWASYPLPGADGLTSTELAALLSGRQLGTLAIVPGGAQ
ncbi:hypothetical protein ACFVH9_08685 [Streptomyces hirsutus]|uniref:hypothetical protein n=1 Tax=Streptomyces hirsutus TaxID=35620 RepID=UPI0036310BDB